MAKDAALSRRRHGFDSRWEYHLPLESQGSGGFSFWDGNRFSGSVSGAESPSGLTPRVAVSNGERSFLLGLSPECWRSQRAVFTVENASSEDCMRRLRPRLCRHASLRAQRERQAFDARA